MRCKLCNNKFHPDDWRINKFSGTFDDWCRACVNSDKESRSERRIESSTKGELPNSCRDNEEKP